MLEAAEPVKISWFSFLSRSWFDRLTMNGTGQERLTKAQVVILSRDLNLPVMLSRNEVEAKNPGWWGKPQTLRRFAPHGDTEACLLEAPN
jgi:hypothetical protein